MLQAFLAIMLPTFIGLFFLLLGIQLLRGRWIKLVTGSISNKLTVAEAKKIGQSVGKVFIGFAAYCLLIIFNLLSNIGTDILHGSILFILIVAGYYIFRAIARLFDFDY